MFLIGKTISQIPRYTYPNTARLISEVTRNPNQKKPVERRLYALQCKLFGLPVNKFELPPTPPELVGFQGFMFKNKDQVIRLEKEAIQYKQMK